MEELTRFISTMKRLSYSLLVFTVCASVLWFMLSNQDIMDAEPVGNPENTIGSSQRQNRVEVGQVGAELTAEDSLVEGVPSAEAIAVFFVPNDLSPVALSDDPGISYQERVKAIANLDFRLEQSGLDQYFEYILSPDGLALISPSRNYRLKSDVIGALTYWDDPEDRLTEALVQIYRDPKQDPLMQEYAIQYLSITYGDSLNRIEIDNIFVDALNNGDSNHAGTTFLALQRLKNEGLLGDETVDAFKVACLAVCEDPSASIVHRITAIQAAGAAGFVESMDSLSFLLRQESTKFSLRLAAIAALGEIGLPESQLLLEEQLGNPNTTVQSAAEIALAKLALK